MKRIALILSWVVVIGIAAVVTMAGPADTIYNKQGQAVQVYAPNYFLAVTPVKTQVALTNTLAFEIDSTTDGIYYLTSTTSTAGAVSNRVAGYEPKGRGVGYGIAFVTYSGCTGTYSAQKGDWTGQ